MPGRPKKLAKEMLDYTDRYVGMDSEFDDYCPMRCWSFNNPPRDEIGRLWHAARNAQIVAIDKLRVLTYRLCDRAGVGHPPYQTCFPEPAGEHPPTTDAGDEHEGDTA